MPQPLRAITTVPAVRDLVYFPFSLLDSLLPERRRGQGDRGPEGAIMPAPVPTRRGALARRASDSP